MSGAIKDYFLVTKPGVVLCNAISSAGGFFLASKGRADAALLWTVIGVSLVVASGCVFNNCVDRDIDRVMTRTRNRVLARGMMSLGVAVFYASLLGVSGAVLLRTATNALCVFIAMAGLAIYVGVYSLFLKRSSVHGTLIGSLAGATPPLAGYCAACNRFDMGALILLSIFILWQMPHCYALFIFRLRDYNATAIPVLPVKRGTAAARRHVIGYILAFLAATPMLTFGGYTGYAYLAVAAALSLSWLYIGWRGYRASDEKLWARRLFFFSIVSIIVLSLMMSIDSRSPYPIASEMRLTRAGVIEGGVSVFAAG